MAWTWLRSCYGFNMRVWVGGVETIYPARWFFCDPDAKWFPSPHGAEASPWLKDFEVNEEWGDDGTLKKLDRGINPGYPGQCFVGDPQWFIDGHLPAVVGTWTPPFVTPCCNHVPPANTDSRCPQPPQFQCTNCVEGRGAYQYKVVATGGTGVFSNSNGTFILTYESACAYGFSDGQHFVGMFIAPTRWAIGIQTNIPSTNADYVNTTPPFHCLGPTFSFPLESQVPPTDTPPTITVSVVS